MRQDLQMGVPNPIAEIYADHRRALFGVASAVLRDAPLAEDAVHDAVSRLLARGVPEGGDAVAYLYRSVRNAALDLDRRRRVRRSEQPRESLFDPDAPIPPASAQELEDRSRLQAAVDALPRDQAEVLLMRAVGRLGFEQIAAAIEIPLGTVASRYARGVEALRGSLQEVYS